MNSMENQKIDYLKEDPIIPNQQIALVSMVEPKNSKMLKNRESFFATRFLKGFLEEYTQALTYKIQNGEEKLTDIIREKLDISYDNIKNKYYEFQALSLDKLEEEFTKKHNKNQEPVITGFKVRGTFPNQLVAAQKAKELNTLETFANIFAVEVGKWTPYCPINTDNITPEYANEELNNLVKSKIDEVEKQKIIFEQEKINKMNKIAEENERKKALNAKEQANVEEVNFEDIVEEIEKEDPKTKQIKKQIKKPKKNRRKKNKKRN